MLKEYDDLPWIYINFHENRKRALAASSLLECLLFPRLCNVLTQCFISSQHWNIKVTNLCMTLKDFCTYPHIKHFFSQSSFTVCSFYPKYCHRFVGGWGSEYCSWKKTLLYYFLYFLKDSPLHVTYQFHQAWIMIQTYCEGSWKRMVTPPGLLLPQLKDCTWGSCSVSRGIQFKYQLKSKVRKLFSSYVLISQPLKSKVNLGGRLCWKDILWCCINCWGHVALNEIWMSVKMRILK